jgi:hypothetical protein
MRAELRSAPDRGSRCSPRPVTAAFAALAKRLARRASWADMATFTIRRRDRLMHSYGCPGGLARGTVAARHVARAHSSYLRLFILLWSFISGRAPS